MTITRSPAGNIQAKVASGPSAGDHDRPFILRVLRRINDERGTALAELALVMPVLVVESLSGRSRSGDGHVEHPHATSSG